MAASLSINNITKSYGQYEVLKSLSLELKSQDRCLLLGANGAGKTTLIRICASLLPPDCGEVSCSTGRVVRSQIGYCGHELLLYSHLTVLENLALVSDLTGLETDLTEYLEKWGLLKYRDRKPYELSKGLQKRASLARAFVHDPIYVFLDEPTSSLDKDSSKLLIENLGGFFSQNADALCLISTHDVESLTSWANRIVILKDHKIQRDSKLGANSSLSKGEVIAHYLEANL